MGTLEFEVVDVFTDRPFTGNPLAVVFGADGLDRGQLQALAREFNLSETVFVLPPTRPEATYRARIFTPARELPFAGHPSIGAAVTQMRRGLIDPGTVHQECGAGILALDVEGSGRATLAGATPTLGAPVDPDPWLEAIGLTEADHVGPPPRRAGCGLEFGYLSLRPESVALARPPSSHVDDLCVFAWDAERRISHARVFAPGSGVLEDPATGSAALGFGVFAVAAGLVAPTDTTEYEIRQGAELGRPSRLDCQVRAEDGRATTVTVRGAVVAVSSGRIAVPPFVG
jgi:trans-2,3-dihydro-3-hydroxyanthranilate isomerase